MTTRRDFLKTGVLGAVGAALDSKSFVSGRTRSFAGDRIRIGIVGFSDRAKNSLIPSFLRHSKELNFEIVAVSDIWSRRRADAEEYFAKEGRKVKLCRNNDELYNTKNIDAVIISTADFQHALHAVEAVQNGKDVYVEKPFAETMEDARTAKDTIIKSGRIVQIGSQRRSAANYITASEYIKSGKFGPIVMVEMTWNVNQPDRWRRPGLVAQIKESDTDWKRFLLNRPFEAWDPRKYLEYRLFWPYSSGIPGQWMSHQIDTVHWFSDYSYPRSVAVNSGIYLWKDGRKNADTLTAVFDYGPSDDLTTGFQVVFSSRFTNSYGGIKELYFSNGGMLNLEKNTITPDGGLESVHAEPMGIKQNMLSSFSLPETEVKTGSNTGEDPMTTAHMRNWMECIRDRKKPNADAVDGYNHSVANIMVTAAMHTGEKAVFDEQNQEVLAGGRIFKF